MNYPRAPPQAAAKSQPAPGTAPGSAGDGSGAGAGVEASTISTEKASDLLRQLRSATSAWFSSVRNGLQEPYAYDKAQADQERIGELFAALSQELRKTGLENLFVDDKMKNTQGEEVKLAKLPKQVLAKEADATSAKIIQDLKDITAKLGSELEDMHGVADNACRQLSQPFPV